MPSKNILMSKTFWGAALALVAVLFPGVFVTLGLGDSAMLADKIVGGLGAVLAIYGRFAATSTVSILGK